MNPDNFHYSVIILIIAISVYMGFSVLYAAEHQSITRFTNAPDCNNTIPSGETICKWSNNTWLVCEKTKGVIADEHLRNMVWCNPVEVYDVRT